MGVPARTPPPLPASYCLPSRRCTADEKRGPNGHGAMTRVAVSAHALIERRRSGGVGTPAETKNSEHAASRWPVVSHACGPAPQCVNQPHAPPQTASALASIPAACVHGQAQRRWPGGGFGHTCRSCSSGASAAASRLTSTAPAAAPAKPATPPSQLAHCLPSHPLPRKA